MSYFGNFIPSCKKASYKHAFTLISDRPIDKEKLKKQTSKELSLDASKIPESEKKNNECFGKGFVDFQRTFGLDIEMQAMTQLGKMKELQKNGSMKDLTVFSLKNELEKYKQEKVCCYLI